MRIGVELVILFCDTSALLKLLVDKAQSDQMRQISTNADAIGVCRISWAETIAALARRQREDPNSSADLEEARQHLIHSWSTFSIVEVNQPLVETAGRFADPVRHAVTITSELDQLDQLGADGRIGGRGAWIKSQAQQHHQILRTQDELRLGR